MKVRKMITELLLQRCHFQACWRNWSAAHVREVLSAAPLVQAPETRQQLLDWRWDGDGRDGLDAGQSRRPRVYERVSDGGRAGEGRVWRR